MQKKKIKFGMGGIFMPPPELNARAVQGYEQAGLDFVCYRDQLCMTFPRTIWTPDHPPLSVFGLAGRATGASGRPPNTLLPKDEGKITAFPRWERQPPNPR